MPLLVAARRCNAGDAQEFIIVQREILQPFDLLEQRVQDDPAPARLRVANFESHEAIRRSFHGRGRASRDAARLAMNGRSQFDWADSLFFERGTGSLRRWRDFLPPCSVAVAV